MPLIIHLLVCVSSAAYGYWIPPTLLHQTQKPLLLPGKQALIVPGCCQQTQQLFPLTIGNLIFYSGIKDSMKPRKTNRFLWNSMEGRHPRELYQCRTGPGYKKMRRLNGCRFCLFQRLRCHQYTKAPRVRPQNSAIRLNRSPRLSCHSAAIRQAKPAIQELLRGRHFEEPTSRPAFQSTSKKSVLFTFSVRM